MAKIGEMSGSMLDAFDRHILRVVQADNQLSHGAIGEQVGLSGSAVRRRLARLREAGIIARDVAIVAAETVGITLLVTIAFAYETPEVYDAFVAQTNALPQVRQCYHIAGSADYFLIVHVPTLEYYEIWAREQFMANDAIKRYDTIVVWSCKKFETAVEL